MNWILAALFGVLAYGGISLMGQLSGGAGSSALGAAVALFRPYAFAALIVGNTLWAVALYYGLRETRAAVPALIALGVIVSFAYSVAFLGAGVTPWRLAGLVFILAGIYLLA